MKAKIKDKEEVAEGTMRIVFDLMGQKIDFEAGQYILITIPNPPYIDEDGNKRHFSISSPPEDKDIVITTRIRPSAFKRSLAEIPVGFEVEVGPIEGEFVLPENTNRPLVFLAGGIGITPYISMLGHVRSKKLPYKITLIYSNKDRQSTAYMKELETLTKELADFKTVLTMTEDPEWPGEERRVDKEFILNYIPDPHSRIYYISGPPNFVEGMRQVLEEAGVENSNINLERFTGY